MFTTHMLLVSALAALVPLAVGFLWYNPKTFGNVWIKASKVNPEDAKSANMVLIFGLTYVFSFFLAMILISVVIHQGHLFSLIADQPGFRDENSHARQIIAPVLQEFGQHFRTFKHGAFHGTVAGIMIAFPIIGINALFERKDWKYIVINAGFWTVCLAIMGGIICQFS